MRFTLGRATIAAIAAVALSGCPSKYPSCNSDEDCNRDQPRGEFCVNQTCQKCRNDKDCAEGQRCNAGRCDPLEGWCKDDAGCNGGLCINNHCQPCKDDSECGEGGRCRSGKCFRKGQALPCATDNDCPDGFDCKNGFCTSAIPQPAVGFKAPCALQPIYFDFNESMLTNEAVQVIDADLACIQKIGRQVNLVGRSDPRGTEEYNLALSERRSQSVKDRLVRLGCDGSRLRTLPKGELEATGRDEAGWAQDRRVDFEWLQ
jgi:peptidoglycan-associated lipoprotein